MEYVRKTIDCWGVFGLYSKRYGWEEVFCSTVYNDVKQALKDHRECEPEYLFKIKKYRIKKWTQ
jgi:hypothetical protein